jgi:adenylate kinase
MRIVFMGASESVQGTQAQRLVKQFGIPQISTGDILRQHRKDGTELGKRADAIMAAGRLVDDATMLEIIRHRVAQPDAQDGFILDGFPRTQAQAEALGALMRELATPIDAVVLFEVGADALVRRISGRRTCSLCNKVFNIYSAPPASPATDCVAGSNEHQLFQRKDDEEATVKERLRVYEESTRPVLTYYSASGQLRTVSAEGAPEEITRRLLAALAQGAPVATRPSTGPPRRANAQQAAPAAKATAESRAPQTSRSQEDGRAPWRRSQVRKGRAKSRSQGRAQDAPRAAQVKALRAASFRPPLRASPRNVHVLAAGGRSLQLTAGGSTSAPISSSAAIALAISARRLTVASCEGSDVRAAAAAVADRR